MQEFGWKIAFFVLVFSVQIAAESFKSYIPLSMDDIISFVEIDNRPEVYEASYTSNDDVVLIQKSAGLMWVNEPDQSKGKCAKVHTQTYRSDFERAKGFCQSQAFGVFAGFTNWRTPTSSELKAFILATKNMDVHYDAPCKKLLALKNRNGDTGDDASYTTITTRFSAVRAQDAGNVDPSFGLRCVRDME